MKGNIMDKKILLSGAAALLLVGNMYATPANASAISLSIGGEAKITAGMSDKCFTAADAADDIFAFLDPAPGMTGAALTDTAQHDAKQDLESNMVTLGHASGLDLTSIDTVDDIELEGVEYTVADIDSGTTYGTGTNAGLGSTARNVIIAEEGSSWKVTTVASGNTAGTYANGDGITFFADQVDETTGRTDVTFLQDPCEGASEVIDWGYGKELTISASGTLANGLSVSFSDKIDLTDVDGEEGAFEMSFDGAFGSLLVKDGASSAVDAVMLTNFDTGVLTGQKVGGGLRGRMATETAANGGKGFLYSAPSMGGIDFNLGWTPSGSNASTDAAEYENIFSFGATMSMDAITIAAGMETASSDTATAASCLAPSITSFTAQNIYNEVYGGNICGDQQLTYVGAEFSVADLTLNAGWQKLDSEEADDTIYGLKAATSVGAYDLSVVYHNNKREYVLGNVEDTQSAIGVGLSTALGDGVDLTFDFATNDVDLASQATTVGGLGSQNNYAAEFAIVAGF
jgi:hypothetical protein